MRIIGIPKERKIGERRIAITPSSVQRLTEAGIQVLIEHDAGLGCDYTNEDFIKCGAQIVTQEQVWEAPLILKVKEPMSEEYQFFKENQIIWGFLHLPANYACVAEMLEKNITSIASETIVIDGTLKLLKPVSEIAGRRSLFIGLHYLEQRYGGRGILLTGTSDIEAGKVVILGGGVVGQNAAQMALGVGCNVVILELNDQLITKLQTQFPNAIIEKSDEETIYKNLKEADVVISTILIPGGKPPKIIKEYMVKEMKKGSVIVDVSSDQGGTCETLDHQTSHANPIEVIHDVIHYAVPNMPGEVPVTATQSIQGVIDLIISLEDFNNDCINKNIEVKSGVQTQNGQIINESLKSGYNK